MLSTFVNSFFTKLSRSVNKSNYKSALSVYSTYSQPYINKPVEIQVVDKSLESTVTQNVLERVNEELKNNPCRTFAVIYVCGKQFKVTAGDSIIIEGYWPPDVGDKIRLDKVLCAGSANFSLFGTPLVQPGLVNVCATVIEKTLSHTKVHFRKKRRKQYMRINFYRCERTLLRINDVEIGEIKDDL